MSLADLLTLCTRIFAALCLVIIAAAYAVRGEYIPTILFGMAGIVVGMLAFSLLRARRQKQPSPQDQQEETHS